MIAHGRHIGGHIPGTIGTSNRKEFEETQSIYAKYKKLCDDTGVRVVPIHNFVVYYKLSLIFPFFFNLQRACSFNDVFYGTMSSQMGVQICNEAYKVGAHGIIVGSRGLGAASRAVLGSVSHSILHECDLPITIVRNGKPLNQ